MVTGSLTIGGGVRISDCVTYMIIKLSSNTITLDTTTIGDKIIIDGVEENSIDLYGITNKRIIVVSNGDKWFTI